MSVRWPRWDRTASRDRADMIDHALPAEPIDKMDANEPIDATDSIEPTEPIDSTEFFDAIERNESSDQSEKREFLDDISSVCRTLRFRRGSRSWRAPRHHGFTSFCVPLCVTEALSATQKSYHPSPRGNAGTALVVLAAVG
jgi:hypothetical protein